MSDILLREWQKEAITRWVDNNYRGIISVVTGGGKTIFALACIKKLHPKSTLIVVPTSALLEQWWEEVANFFNLGLEEINIVTRTLRYKQGTINIAVINTAVKLIEKINFGDLFLIVDECHKAASDHFKDILKIPSVASLGLSATPKRPYDDGLDSILVPSLGDVIYNYDYSDALRDRVIVPFELRNIVFELEEETLDEYNKLSKSIARSISNDGIESEKTIALFIKRARVLNLSFNRIRLTLKLIANNKNKRTLVFHEDIEACNIIYSVLNENHIRAGVYHSKMSVKSRAEMLKDYRIGKVQVLVTCRALDEGFNVPETEIGIIAASTATRRQRIQRLGRIVRPANDKEIAIIYTLVSTEPEIRRLKDEEELLDGVANVKWSRV